MHTATDKYSLSLSLTHSLTCAANDGSGLAQTNHELSSVKWGMGGGGVHRLSDRLGRGRDKQPVERPICKKKNNIKYSVFTNTM